MILKGMKYHMNRINRSKIIEINKELKYTKDFKDSSEIQKDFLFYRFENGFYGEVETVESFNEQLQIENEKIDCCEEEIKRLMDEKRKIIQYGR